jgi:hypothetical protein
MSFSSAPEDRVRCLIPYYNYTIAVSINKSGAGQISRSRKIIPLMELDCHLPRSNVRMTLEMNWSSIQPQ